MARVLHSGRSNEQFDPVNVSLLRPVAIVAVAELLADLLEQPRWMGWLSTVHAYSIEVVARSGNQPDGLDGGVVMRDSRLSGGLSGCGVWAKLSYATVNQQRIVRNRDKTWHLWCVVACLVALGGQSLAFAEYSLKEVEARPIPKAKLLELWKKVAMDRCEEALKNHNTSPEQCRQITSERFEACVASLPEGTSEIISTRSENREIGRHLLYCSTPYYFCKGVEVRNEQEARARCG